jgi:hypothetical protein
MDLGRACAVVSFFALSAAVSSAQEVKTYVVGTYYRCSEATETRADAIYKSTFAPLVKKQIDAGKLVAAGWARHWLGGEWRRLEYVTGTDLGAIVSARDAMIAEMMGPQLKLSEEFSAICSSHDDYIWSSVASSQALDAVARERSKVVMSTYFECDSREKEADAIVKAAFAPVLNAHVKEGKIARWNWMEHVAGGKYRRILVLDGADHKSLLSYWSAFSPAVEAAQPELSRRFSDICHSHSDYVWDMGTE